MERHAVYCGTRNIYEDMETAAKSLIGMTNVDQVHFLIEDNNFPKKLPDIIKCYNVCNQTFFKSTSPNLNNKLTYMVLMRIALCYILDSSIHKVLSLDCDTIVVNNASDIWNLPIDDYYFAGVKEFRKSLEGLVYCNQGVTLYNLDKMRNGKAAECIDVLNRHKFENAEQDAINYLCQGYIYEMPAEYNINYFVSKTNNIPRIIHYAGIPRENWYNHDYPVFWRNKSWDEVMKIHSLR